MTHLGISLSTLEYQDIRDDLTSPWHRLSKSYRRFFIMVAYHYPDRPTYQVTHTATGLVARASSIDEVFECLKAMLAWHWSG